MAPLGSVDQDAMLFAMGQTSTCSFQTIAPEFCAVASDGIEDAIIRHDSASAGIAKISNLARRLHFQGAPMWLVDRMPAKRSGV